MGQSPHGALLTMWTNYSVPCVIFPANPTAGIRMTSSMWQQLMPSLCGVGTPRLRLPGGLEAGVPGPVVAVLGWAGHMDVCLSLLCLESSSSRIWYCGGRHPLAVSSSSPNNILTCASFYPESLVTPGV